MSQRHIDTPPAARIAFLEGEVERLDRKWAKLAIEYEELREVIDDGNESMTHEDAVAELKAMREEIEQHGA